MGALGAEAAVGAEAGETGLGAEAGETGVGADTGDGADCADTGLGAEWAVGADIAVSTGWMDRSTLAGDTFASARLVAPMTAARSMMLLPRSCCSSGALAAAAAPAPSASTESEPVAVQKLRLCMMSSLPRVCDVQLHESLPGESETIRRAK
ncbi:hypothetical protein AHIS1636_01660 [Arthrobacter mangrovi]|uniref:Uncharacterized protein n=1 Tax=Arthrobacter mangrovi TaxID=2966350 RepID=A0ABQ5MP29_9MICC|nr:hypothetical protein AHIS1636_01660 [Arthrobacter mangrovi]